ncbi:MAG: hypothetical protein HY568_02105 [Candidatus Latescibacteria bacterium]|nr:hypothetical protein [Candidatus Latescibacterota bacterium]
MNETHCVAIVSSRHGRGFVCFFDEPFGEQTPFERAGGYLVRYDSGVNEGGPIPTEDLALGLDAWLKKNGWRRVEEVEALVEI